MLATLVRTLGSLQLAEDAVQDAAVAALTSWPATGVPDDPRAWLTVTARHKAYDILRREAVRPVKETRAGWGAELATVDVAEEALEMVEPESAPSARRTNAHQPAARARAARRPHARVVSSDLPRATRQPRRLRAEPPARRRSTRVTAAVAQSGSATTVASSMPGVAGSHTGIRSDACDRGAAAATGLVRLLHCRGGGRSI